MYLLGFGHHQWAFIRTKVRRVWNMLLGVKTGSELESYLESPPTELRHAFSVVYSLALKMQSCRSVICCSGSRFTLVNDVPLESTDVP